MKDSTVISFLELSHYSVDQNINLALSVLNDTLNNGLDEEASKHLNGQGNDIKEVITDIIKDGNALKFKTDRFRNLIKSVKQTDPALES